MTKAAGKQMSFPELADWVVSRTLKAGANDCKVSLSRRRAVEINYRDRKPEVIKEATTQGLYLEVFVNNRYAGQSTPDFRTKTLETFITDLDRQCRHHGGGSVPNTSRTEVL